MLSLIYFNGPKLLSVEPVFFTPLRFAEYYIIQHSDLATGWATGDLGLDSRQGQ
jgi:hypothetical protein